MKKLIFFILLAMPGIASADQTILWIPYHSAVISEVLKIAENNENIKLTIALDQISPAIEKRIKTLEERGQIEVALRIPHDPIIPLLYYPNSKQVSWENKPPKAALPDDAPYFMGLRIGTAMDNARKNLKRRPQGLVLQPGTLMKDYFPLAKGIGIKWIASGSFYYYEEESEENSEEGTNAEAGTDNEAGTATPAEGNNAGQSYTQTESVPETQGNIYENQENAEEAMQEEEPIEATIAEVSGIKVLPFTAYNENQENEAEEFLVFDETAEEDPGPIRKALKDYLSKLSVKTVTASEAAENAVAAETDAEELAKAAQPWTAGGYDRWAEKRNQMGALVAMSQTRNELMKYLNSKAGNMKEASPAFNAYYEAENSRKLMNLGSTDKSTAKDTEIALRASLSNVYSIMGKTAPHWALSSLSDAGTGRNTAYMRIAMKQTGFEIKNDQTKPVFETIPANLPETVDPYKLWKLKTFKVEVNKNNLIFRFTPEAINNSGSHLSGFSHIALDLYIDMNHRVNAGSAAALPGRPMKIGAEDSWEYAMEISPSAVYLYRSTSMGPKQLGKYRARVQGGAITVTIPSTVLRGTPRKWGYVAFMLVPQDSGRFAIADTLGTRKSSKNIYAVRPSITD